MAYGYIAYEGFRAALGGVYDGRELPAWEELDDHTRLAHEIAAGEVANAIYRSGLVPERFGASVVTPDDVVLFHLAEGTDLKGANAFADHVRDNFPQLRDRSMIIAPAVDGGAHVLVVAAPDAGEPETEPVEPPPPVMLTGEGDIVSAAGYEQVAAAQDPEDAAFHAGMRQRARSTGDDVAEDEAPAGAMGNPGDRAAYEQARAQQDGHRNQTDSFRD